MSDYYIKRIGGSCSSKGHWTWVMRRRWKAADFGLYLIGEHSVAHTPWSTNLMTLWMPCTHDVHADTSILSAHIFLHLFICKCVCFNERQHIDKYLYRRKCLHVYVFIQLCFCFLFVVFSLSEILFRYIYTFFYTYTLKVNTWVKLLSLSTKYGVLIFS